MFARKRENDDAGAVAVLVAVGMTALLIVAAMVLDFGLARLDRQTNKTVADSTAAAGVQAMGSDYRNMKPWRGVCTARAYLRANFDALDEAGVVEAFTTGTGGGVAGNPCVTGNVLQQQACTPDTPSTWAVYTARVGPVDSPRLLVEIRGGYDVNDFRFPEEAAYPLLTNDQGTVAYGNCDDIGVIITQRRKPGLGSVADVSDVTTRVRSVGRMVLGQEGKAPVALLILERSHCSAINTDGNTTRLYVRGVGTRPGLIHSDSLGNAPGNSGNCNSTKIAGGSGTIKAFQAAEGGAAGIIGIRALLPGEPGAVPGNAYDAPPAVQAEGAPGSLPEGRPLVTRARVDERYLTPVTNRVNAVEPMFSWTQAAAEAEGYRWETPTQCGGNGISGPIAGAKVYINCPGGAVFDNASFGGTSLIVNGSVTIKSGATLALPNAEQFYVKGPGTSGANDIGLDVGGTLALHTNGASSCESTDSEESGRAELILRSGAFKQTVNNSVLRLCHTTVITLGNTASLPSTYDYNLPGPAPSDNSRNGYLNITGGTQDWSAPNLVRGEPATNWSTLEDLAFWTETSLQSRIGGNGTMKLEGVFMLPNANPFRIGGTGTQDVRNSQYIVRKLQAAGGGVLEMQPDPNDAVQFDYFGDFILVR